MIATELKALLADMSLDEKIAQMVQVYGSEYLDNDTSAVTGPLAALPQDEDGSTTLVGSVLGTGEADKLIRLQQLNLERQPHHIPMLFMMDVIHGMKTIFPAPLAQGATFDPDMYEKCMQVAAKEAAASGLHVTFSPMCDLVRDPRWGRVVESTGEDPYLNGQMAAAAVRGFQGQKREDMKEKWHICACVKHFAGYGAATAGRDYTAAEMSERTFRDFYLPAYQEAIKAGAGMVMTSFNPLNGIPASINIPLMQRILRDELSFDGVLISDYAALAETIVHGCAEDETEAAAKGLAAGVDIDMMSTVYASGLKKLVGDGVVSEELIDECVMRILTLKNDLGLFENPYKDADPEEEKRLHLCPAHRALARENAEESFVLLKNDVTSDSGRPLLPLTAGSEQPRIAFIGPYVDSQKLNTSWAITGDYHDNTSFRDEAEKVFYSARTTYSAGCHILGNEDREQLIGTPDYHTDLFTEEEQTALRKEAVEAARAADVVVLLLGEHYLQTGEAASRSDITLPHAQLELLRSVAAVNPNIVTVLYNGRPLDLREVSALSRSVLEVWLPGTEGSAAIVRTLIGENNPQGKLPMSFPCSVGQVPIFYNAGSTGRPYHPGSMDKFLSKYLDVPNTPLYPFGYGLSYTSYDLSKVTLSQDTLQREGDPTAEAAKSNKAIETLETIKPINTIEATISVTNTGSCAGTETVQLYIQDPVASVARPVKELKSFRKVTLLPGETKNVTFSIDESMLRFTRADGTYGSEPGVFRVYIGDSSKVAAYTEFHLV